MTWTIASGYIRDNLGGKSRKKTIEKCIEKLSELEFDAIACAGISGLTVAPIVAHLMDKNLIVLRKCSENSHASQEIEGMIDGLDRPIRIVILDDLIDTGATINKIVSETKEMAKEYSIKLDFLGVLLYDEIEISGSNSFVTKERLSLSRKIKI